MYVGNNDYVGSGVSPMAVRLSGSKGPECRCMPVGQNRDKNFYFY